MSKYYNIEEVQTLLQISKPTVYRLIKKQKIKAKRQNKKYVIEESEIKAFQKQYRNQINPHAKSSRQICDEFNISLQRLYNLTHRYEIPHYNVVRQNYSYFKPEAVKKIKYHLTHNDFKTRGTRGVFRPNFEPNTEQCYNHDIDYSPFELCKRFQPPINTAVMNNWLNYQKVKYSVDKNHQVFFTPEQFNEIKQNYKNYPNETIYNTQTMADILNIDRMKLQNICIMHRIYGHKVLGDNHKYYTKDQLNYLTEILKPKSKI